MCLVFQVKPMTLWAGGEVPPRVTIEKQPATTQTTVPTMAYAHLREGVREHGSGPQTMQCECADRSVLHGAAWHGDGTETPRRAM